MALHVWRANFDPTWRFALVSVGRKYHYLYFGDVRGRGRGTAGRSGLLDFAAVFSRVLCWTNKAGRGSNAIAQRGACK